MKIESEIQEVDPKDHIYIGTTVATGTITHEGLRHAEDGSPVQTPVTALQSGRTLVVEIGNLSDDTRRTFLVDTMKIVEAIAQHYLNTYPKED